ncbi:MAG: putative beta-barrel porin 2 [Candidatus Electronema aureum]|uniref:Beta-barrel porin 2 n=1 Tax=Candidatus Electronema aureum TaxID=2005002 RepID=A0A521G0J8_9BACT|nr:MAG: putative beta-barrel porin 2 [Candidatus Electronema aureum]
MTKKYQIGGLLLLLFAAQAKAADAPPASTTPTPVAEAETAVVEESGEATEDASTAVVADDETQVADDAADSDEGYVFGYRNGFIHGALAAKGEWTDNLYNTDADQQDNFLTKISPSVWFTLPRRSKRPVQIVADNTAVGGMQYSQSDSDSFNKIQAYLAGTIDFMAYSADSDLNHAEGDLDAMLQYKPAEQITLQLLDKYTHSQDIFNIAESTVENDRVYDSNIFGAGAAWYSEDRFSVKAGYRNFALEYDDAINDFMNRTDNGFDAALHYEYSDKTNFFVQYQYLMAEYDKKKMPDNDNNFLSAGVNWQTTVKTTLMAKAGFQTVDYDDLGQDFVFDDSDSTFFFESQGIWQATLKSSLLLNAKYSIEQSDSEQALNKSVFALRVALDHRFTDRIRGDINFVYENSDYAQFSGDTRSDDRWYLKPEVQFALNKWLFLNAYCSYDTKDSNYDGLNYDTTTVGVGVRGSF